MRLKQYTPEQLNNLTQLSYVHLSCWSESHFHTEDVSKETPKTYVTKHNRIMKDKIGVSTGYSTWVLVGDEMEVIKLWHQKRIEHWESKIEEDKEYLVFHQEQLNQMEVKTNEIR